MHDALVVKRSRSIEGRCSASACVPVRAAGPRAAPAAHWHASTGKHSPLHPYAKGETDAVYEGVLCDCVDAAQQLGRAGPAEEGQPARTR